MPHRYSRPAARVAALSGVLLAAAAATAQVIEPFDPITPDQYGWSRGDANTTYYEWDFFGSRFFSTANFPDFGQIPFPLPAGWETFEAGELTGSSVLTGNGDIYALNGPAYYRFDFPTVPAAEVANPVEREPTTALDVPPGGLYMTVIVQQRTVGFEMVRGTNVVTDTINQQLPIGPDNPIEDNWPVPGVLPFEDTETYRFDRPDEIFLGDFVDTRFVYEIAGAPGYLHHVLETVQHVSLRNMVIDTAVWTAPAGPACPGDANGDNEVTVADLLAVVGTLGTNDPTGDVDGDGQVAVSDLLAVIGNLGVICS